MPTRKNGTIRADEGHGKVTRIAETNDSVGYNKAAVRPVLLNTINLFRYLRVPCKDPRRPPDFGVGRQALLKQHQSSRGIPFDKRIQIRLEWSKK